MNAQAALMWWSAMDLEQQFYKTTKHNALIEGDHTRHPNSLSDYEILLIWEADQAPNHSLKEVRVFLLSL